MKRSASTIAISNISLRLNDLMSECVGSKSVCACSSLRQYLCTTQAPSVQDMSTPQYTRGFATGLAMSTTCSDVKFQHLTVSDSTRRLAASGRYDSTYSQCITGCTQLLCESFHFKTVSFAYLMVIADHPVNGR